MKNIFHHIEHLKTKPHQHRERIALGAAAGGTALIALVWLVGNLVSGSFAIKATSFADLTSDRATVQTTDSAGGQNLAGVGAAAAVEDTSAPAHIEIVDTTKSAPSSKKQYEQTTIPF